MLTIRYSSGLQAELDCPYCGRTYPLSGVAQRNRAEPWARHKIMAHFHHDQNAHVPECPSRPAALRQLEDMPWEAIDVSTGERLAYGVVHVERRAMEAGAFAVGPIRVLQDFPARVSLDDTFER